MTAARATAPIPIDSGLPPSHPGELTVRWRLSVAWWLTLLVGVPAVIYAGAVVTGNVRNFPFDPWPSVRPRLVRVGCRDRGRPPGGRPS